MTGKHATWPGFLSRADACEFFAQRGRLSDGRAFRLNDRVGATPLVIINETLAQRLWPGQRAVGKRLRKGQNVYEIIGIARDTKY